MAPPKPDHNDTALPEMTTGEQASHPDVLGLTRADELRLGDVVYFVRQRVHAHITIIGASTTATDRPDRVDLQYLDGYNPGGYDRNIALEHLDALAAGGYLRLVATDVSTPGARWGLAGDRHGRDPEWEPVTPGARLPTGQLTFDRCRSRKTTNGFLEHPLVNHKRGSTRFGRARFVARRPDDRMAAVAVVDRPSAGAECDGTTIELTRYASHPEGVGVRENPNNTASWMLGRACRWAALEGFERVITYSGVAANDGGIYRAANFERDGPSDRAGDGWTNRDGRDAWTNAGEGVRWRRLLYATEPAAGVARRADARPMGEAGATTERTTLGEFATADSSDLTTDRMALTREELTDDHSDTPAEGRSFTPRARQLFDTHGPAAGSAVLEAASTERTRGVPPAVFGADVDGQLVAALAVGGDALAADATAQVVGYAARPTAWPEQTAGWLLARARDWAVLDGYDRVHVPAGTFEVAGPSTGAVATGTSFEPVRADGDGSREERGYWYAV